jgi:HSP20 family molecular chaperone IbpA
MNKQYKDLLTSVDVLNTLHGGVSQASVALRQLASSREICVKVPGINREALQVEVNNDKLSVFYLIPIESNGKMIYMPQVVYNKVIPYFIDISEINASYEGDELIVQLPYNKLSSGYNKKIEIGE